MVKDRYRTNIKLLIYEDCNKYIIVLVPDEKSRLSTICLFCRVYGYVPLFLCYGSNRFSVRHSTPGNDRMIFDLTFSKYTECLPFTYYHLTFKIVKENLRNTVL